MIKEFARIDGYYDECRPPAKEWHANRLAEIIEELSEPRARWVIRNREPRQPISSQKRAIIHERDGGECQYCGTGSRELVLDHIIPRSAFPANWLHIADRSDNLQSSCWDCNEKRSNYEHLISSRKRLGVTVKCWDCLNPRPCEPWEEDDVVDGWERPYMDVLVFCGSCGVTCVPTVHGWVL